MKRLWTRRHFSTSRTNSNNPTTLHPRRPLHLGVEFIAEEDIVPSEHDEEIKRLLDEFVRPAVEQDGGAIDFKAFKEGKVLRAHARRLQWMPVEHARSKAASNNS